MVATDSGSPKGVAERAQRAAVAPRHQIEPFFKETAKEVLVAFARNPNLRENDLLRLLERKDLPVEVVSEIAAHKVAVGSYAVKLALTRHPKAPRLVSLPNLKLLHLFDLVGICQGPAVPAHVKLIAEETILKKVESLPRGEKITLGRRGPGRVAAGLLMTDDRELARAALDNPFLTEAHLIRALGLEDLPRITVELIAQHERWSHCYNVRLGLIRNPLTPLPHILAFIPDVVVNDLRDVCRDRRMPEQVRKYILAHCAERLAKKPPTRPAAE